MKMIYRKLPKKSVTTLPVTDFVSDALLLFRKHAVGAAMSEPRQAVLEIVLIAWWSAAALYSCHKCVCFSLQFNSHDVTDPMIAETAAKEIRILVVGRFDFFVSFRNS